MVVFCRYRRIVSDPFCPMRMILLFLTTTYFKDFECSVKSPDTFNSAMFQDVSISLPRHEVTPQRTRRNWSSRSGLKHLRDVYVTFIHYLLSLLALVSPTSWTDRSFELTLMLLVFTQAFHKISIQTSINNTENMPQVTRSNNSAISIDNDASDL